MGVAVGVCLAAIPSPARATVCAPLPCSEILVDLPYSLDFGSDEGGVQDGNGVGTGFTYLDPPSNGSGYLPANLNLDTAAGVLDVITTDGLNDGSSDSQDNALAVGIDAPSQVTRIEATVQVPPAGTGNSEQAGIWFGNDEDDYLKLVVISTPAGTRIQGQLEVGGSESATSETSALDLTGHSVTLSLVADPLTEDIDASYRVDGGEPVSVSSFRVPGEFFSFDAAGIDPEIGTDSFGGILASHGDATAPLTYSFDDFSVVKERDAIPGPVVLSDGIAFDRTSFPVPNPTSIAVGPDGRLYVATLLGDIHALTLDPDHQVTSDEVITTLGTRLTLGLTVDPKSTPGNVILWVSHSSPSLDDGVPNSSVVSRLSGPGLTERQDVITGLPRAKGNHAINSIHFGPDGKLYIAQGGNTGAGAPNSSNSEFGDMREQPLSAALLVADVNDPGFDGSCNNDSDIFGPPPCDVKVYSSGLRNMYDFVFHSNGSIYGANNGLGVTGTFPPTATPPCFGMGDLDPWDADPPGDNPGKQPDDLNRLEQGKYYGHPNPTRDECVFRDGSFQGVPPLPNYEPPIYNLGESRSADGIIEYRSKAHCGALKGGLIISNYSIGDNLTRVRLSPDGSSVLSAENLIGGFDDPLPLAQDGAGTIYVGEFTSGQVTALLPADVGCWSTRAALPIDLSDAGGAALGGNLYVVGGKSAGGHRTSVYTYNPATDSWNTAADLPGVGIENPAVAVQDGKVYVFGGSTAAFSGAVSTAAVFDPKSGSWSSLPEMPTPRAGATAESLGGKIYVAGGLGADGASLDTVEVFDPAAGADGGWSSVTPMSSRRDNAGSAVLDGKLYVFGGRIRDSDGTTVDGALKTTEMYDPGTDTWVPRAPMLTGRRSVVVGELEHRAQVMGGENGTADALAENQEYDPVTDSWRTLTPMRTPRHGAAGGTIGSVVYVAGGGPHAGSSFSATNEAFAFQSDHGPDQGISNPNVPGGGPPTSSFELMERSYKGRKGRVKLTFDLPGPGVLSVTQAGEVGAQATVGKKRRLVRPASVTADRAGVVAITIIPTRAARAILRQRRKLKLSLRATFGSTDGSSSSQIFRLVLKSR
jgi:glucose/arabinose dehydrogenase